MQDLIKALGLLALGGIRGEDGEFLLARSQRVEGNLKPIEGEALGLLCALRWVEDLNFQQVIF